ncbi:MAG: lipoyl(octanoyl) transferase LipB [Blastocatellia bacterium]
MRTCEFRYLGRVPYAEALALQKSLHEARKRGEVQDTLLLLEHPHVITLGTSANRANIIASPELLAARGVEVFDTGRGGDVTCHGPGQLVGYPIISLAPDRCDIRRYVRDLQEVLIRAAADFGVEAYRHPEHIGVWVGDEKLAAIGIRVSRWVTMHGFAFNVTTDLDYFRLIVPCGITDHGVTSLEKLLGKKIELPEVASRVIHHFGEVFNRQMTATDEFKSQISDFKFEI